MKNCTMSMTNDDGDDAANDALHATVLGDCSIISKTKSSLVPGFRNKGKTSD